jgi:hypothetical protein
MPKPSGKLDRPVGKPHHFDFFCSKRDCKQHIALCQTGSTASLVDMYLGSAILASMEWSAFLLNRDTLMPILRCTNSDCNVIIGRPIDLGRGKLALRLIRNSFVREANPGIMFNPTQLLQRKVLVVCELNKAARSWVA